MSRKRSLGIRWGNRWRPTDKGGVDKARICEGPPDGYKCFDGEVYDWFQYVEIYSARTKKSFISSAEFGFDDEGMLVQTGGTCLGMQELQREIDEGIPREKRSVSKRLLHALNVIHLDWYHLVPLFDEKTGKPITYSGGERKGEQIFRKEQCEGRRCDYCKEKYEKVFGKKVHWSLGTQHLGNVISKMEEIGKDCKNCGALASLEVLTYECIECGHIYIDVEKTQLTDEQIYQKSLEIRKCPECGHEDWMVGQLECSNCQDPERLSLWDVDIDVKRFGKRTDSTVDIVRWAPTELTKELKDMAKPYQFKRIFKGDPLDIQAKFLKIRNPYDKDAEGEVEDYEDDADYAE